MSILTPDVRTWFSTKFTLIVVGTLGDSRCWCGTCSESVCHHQLTLDIYNEVLTFVSIGTFLLSGSASLAVKLVVALLVENAVIVFLL